MTCTVLSRGDHRLSSSAWTCLLPLMSSIMTFCLLDLNLTSGCQGRCSTGSDHSSTIVRRQLSSDLLPLELLIVYMEYHRALYLGQFSLPYTLHRWQD